MSGTVQDAPRVLVVDDDLAMLAAVRMLLQRGGCSVEAVSDPREALAAAREHEAEVALLDLAMPGMSGLELLGQLKSALPELEVLVMTAFASVQTAVAALKAGAYDYLAKPFDNVEEVVQRVQRARERRNLLHRNRQLEEQLARARECEGIVGQSPKMQEIFRLVEGVANSSATVLIHGESGTGKELVARALHAKSARRERRFVAINCGALTETLLESELFGFVRGAFSGATATHKGLFEAADNGTLFLDEIGDISPAMQVRLLRALQEGEIRRVGSSEPLHVDVRVVAATHRDLRKLIAAGQFREDLYYRLNVISLELPPLRERLEDLPLLVAHLVRKLSAKTNKPVEGVSAEAMRRLEAHRWTGNVRELENVLERAVILTTGPTIEPSVLPGELSPGPSASGGSSVAPTAPEDQSLGYTEARRLALAKFQRRYLLSLLDRCANNYSLAARTAGLDRTNLKRLLRESGIMPRGSSKSDLAEERCGTVRE